MYLRGKPNHPAVSTAEYQNQFYKRLKHFQLAQQEYRIKRSARVYLLSPQNKVQVQLMAKLKYWQAIKKWFSFQTDLEDMFLYYWKHYFFRIINGCN